jgi:hypothetical protein
MTNELTVHNGGMPITDLGRILAKSGFFADTRDEAQAIVKVLAGSELGFGAIASMTGFHIIKGRVSMSANLMAAAVKRSGRYNFRVIELTDKACEIAFFEGTQDIGHSRFTLDDAKRAGTQNMDKFPRNMLYARAMSNGVKWYCPDVTGGPVYTPEELGVPVTEDGEIVQGHVIEHQPTVKVVETVKKPAPAANGQRPDDAMPEPADLEKFQRLVDKAQALGINTEFYTVSPFVTLGGIRQAWGELTAAIKAAEQQKAS